VGEKDPLSFTSSSFAEKGGERGGDSKERRVRVCIIQGKTGGEKDGLMSSEKTRGAGQNQKGKVRSGVRILSEHQGVYAKRRMKKKK